MFRIGKPAILAAIILGCVSLTFSQTRIGSIQGTVKDPNGALLPNATVTLTQPVTGYKQSDTTDAGGSYRIVNVPFNTYKLRVEAAGFQASEQAIDLESAVPATFDVALTLEATTEKVTVTAGNEAMVETDRTSSDTDISQTIL